MTVATQPRIFDLPSFAEPCVQSNDYLRQSYQRPETLALPSNPWNWYDLPQAPQFGHFNGDHQSTHASHYEGQHARLSHESPELHPQSAPLSSGQVSPNSVGTPAASLRTILPTASAPNRPTSSKLRSLTQKGSKSASKKAGRNSGSNAGSGNPGPIPASQPRVVQELPDGTRMIEFEYNRKKEKHIYRINTNVDDVDIAELDEDFKTRNAAYPKTADGTSAMKKRFPYETDCNDTAWRLVALNPELDSQRGLIQRAVDSWRNTHPDPIYHSRRVKRQRRSSNHEQPSKGSAALTGPSLSSAMPNPALLMSNYSTPPISSRPSQNGMSSTDDGWGFRDQFAHSPMSPMFADHSNFESLDSAATSFSTQMISTSGVDGDPSVTPQVHAAADPPAISSSGDYSKNIISRSASFNVMPRVAGGHVQFVSQPSSPIGSRSQSFDLHGWNPAPKQQQQQRQAWFN